MGKETRWVGAGKACRYRQETGSYSLMIYKRQGSKTSQGSCCDHPMFVRIVLAVNTGHTGDTTARNWIRMSHLEGRTHSYQKNKRVQESPSPQAHFPDPQGTPEAWDGTQPHGNHAVPHTHTGMGNFLFSPKGSTKEPALGLPQSLRTLALGPTWSTTRSRAVI